MTPQDDTPDENFDDNPDELSIEATSLDWNPLLFPMRKYG
jgi:hypothetical protein